MFKNIFGIASLAGVLAFSPLALAAPRTVTLDVPGMTCSSCPITVKAALMKLDGVQKVAPDLDKKVAVVTYDDSKTSAQQLTLATKNAGYPSTVEAGR